MHLPTDVCVSCWPATLRHVAAHAEGALYWQLYVTETQGKLQAVLTVPHCVEPHRLRST
jgi:hypothetical protein